MKFLLGKKVAMTQVFDDARTVHPVTVLSAGPVTLTQIKTRERDGYDALQFGYEIAKEKRVSKPVRGHTKGLGPFRYFREFRHGDTGKVENGQTLDVSQFAEGDTVVVSGISKGKGFQGVVKRHGFHGGPRTHGQKHSEREPGSISGGSRGGGRVQKGMRMAGRMGGDRVTVKNLKVVKIDPANNLMLVSGAVPGRRGTLLEIRSTKSEILNKSQ